MIKITKDEQMATCLTHQGTMHADEVFASAFLALYLGDITICRSKEVEQVSSDKLIYDIGHGKYDHHQKDALVRSNGIKYAAFGLLYKEYGKDFLKQQKVAYIEEVYTQFEQDFVLQIDAIDNGQFPTIEAPYKVTTLSDMISFFNPSFGKEQTADDNFLRAVLVAQEILRAALEQTISKVEANYALRPLLEEQEGPILRLPCYLPYEQILFNHPKNNDFLFVLYPSNRGGYAAKAIAISAKDKTSRQPFPSAWAGLEKKELEEQTGVKGALFCHVNRFLITANTKDAIEQLLQLALFK